MADNFKVVVKGGGSSGASLRLVLDKLDALERLYEASVSARLKPGAERVRFPENVGALSSLQLNDAQPSRSLVLSVSEPSVPLSYDGEYSGLPGSVRPIFRKAIVAASEKNSDEIFSLYPEKADQMRIFRAFEDLFPSTGEENLLIEEFSEENKVLVFRRDHFEWAKSSMPSLEPQDGIFSGMVKAGVLANSPQFSLYDGGRMIALKPSSQGAIKLRDMFGKVVEISGTAHFEKNGTIKQISDIKNIDQFQYKTQEIDYGFKTYVLNQEISYYAEADIEASGFTLLNDDLGTVSFGTTLAEAIDNSSEDFASIWSEIAEVPEETLHESAIPLRGYLKSIVIEIKDALDDL